MYLIQPQKGKMLQKKVAAAADTGQEREYFITTVT